MRKVKNLFHLVNAITAAVYYGFPGRKLNVIGITGTDGKTTTSHFLYSILQRAGFSTGLITTVEVRIGESRYDTGLHVTTPSPWRLNRFLRQMISAGHEYVVLEVTSHGLDQHRAWGVKFHTGVVTNITSEHLDYHRTMTEYRAAKSKVVRSAKYAVLNKDDSSYDYLESVSAGKVVSYAQKDADFTFERLRDVTIHLPGEYNKYNALAAYTVGSIQGIKAADINVGIESVKSIIGRMEILQKSPFRVIVDFAHTPNGLQQALSSLLKDSGRIISVFGCAGLRDYDKREVMGQISGKLADIVVITAEDPRTEDVNVIIDRITLGAQAAGKQKDKDLFLIPDREKALQFALTELAQEGDTVIITGKGHEKSMCFGTTEHPWSDIDVTKKYLAH